MPKPFELSGADTSWPSSAELVQVAEIRQACQKEIDALPAPAPRDVVGDLRLCRFLRFNSGNVKKATEGYREFLTFRAEAQLDVLRKHVIDLSMEDFAKWVDSVRSPFTPPLAISFGETPDGHLLVFVQPGRFKAVDFVSQRPECHTLDTDLMISWLCVERMLKNLDDRSYEKQKMLYSIKVMDMQGLGKEKLAIFVPELRKFAQTHVSKIMQHYCEHDILILVLNAPFVFRVIHTFAQAIISKRQAARMKVFGNSTSAEVQGIFTALTVPQALIDCARGTLPAEPVTLLCPYAWEDPERVQAFLNRKVPGVVRGEPAMPGGLAAASPISSQAKETEPPKGEESPQAVPEKAPPASAPVMEPQSGQPQDEQQQPKAEEVWAPVKEDAPEPEPAATTEVPTLESPTEVPKSSFCCS
mmetsp:Transcript_27377/g.63897  ORF Transcript_27377/g.63897 Transcript_27377/m.63897 type:complete len:415 (+) Transcript_27377:94-1338(+)